MPLLRRSTNEPERQKYVFSPSARVMQVNFDTSDSCVNTPQGGTPYNGLYREAPPERDTFFRLQVYKRVGISQVEVYKRVRKSVI